MKLELKYTCDICEETIPINFEKSFQEKKLQCPHCGVVYDFSEDDLAKFNECYKNFVQRMKASKKETVL